MNNLKLISHKLAITIGNSPSCINHRNRAPITLYSNSVDYYMITVGRNLIFCFLFSCPVRRHCPWVGRTQDFEVLIKLNHCLLYELSILIIISVGRVPEMLLYFTITFSRINIINHIY